MSNYKPYFVAASLKCFSEWAHGNKIHLKLGIIKNFTGNGQKKSAKTAQNAGSLVVPGYARSPICPWPHGLHIPQCCLNKWPGAAAAAAAITASPAVSSSGQPLWPRLTLTLALAPQSALHWPQVLNIETDTVSNMWYRNLDIGYIDWQAALMIKRIFAIYFFHYWRGFCG